ncbi:MAG: PRC-barrel domain-containing protein [Pseudomonadota bacterium]
MKTVLAAALILMPAAAFAQADTTTPAATAPAPAADEISAPAPASTEIGETTYVRTEPANSVFASDLVGLDVMGSDDEKIGDINDILISGDGSIAGVVIGVGGFLGLGEKDVAVPLGSLNIESVDGRTRAEIAATEAELLEAPLFSRLDGTTSDRLGAFERAYTRAREDAEAALDVAGERASELYDRAGERAGELREGAEELIDSGRDAVQRLTEDTPDETPTTQ